MSMLIENEEQQVTSIKLSTLVGRIAPYLAKRKARVAGVLAIVIAYVGVGRALPILFGYAIDEGIKKQQLSVIYQIAGLYLTFEVLRSVLAFAQSYLMIKLGNSSLFDLREDLIKHVQRLPVQFFDKHPIGRTVTRLTKEIAALGDLFASVFTSMFVNTLEIASILVALSFISVKLTAITVVVTPIVVIIGVAISRRIRSVYKDAKRVLSTINSFTAESINGMKVLRLFNEIRSSRSFFHGLSGNYKNLQMASIKLYAMLWPLLEGFNVAVIASALFFGAYFQSSLGLTVGEITAFILLLQSFFQPVRSILERYTQMQNSLASADRVFALMAQKQESYQGQPIRNRLKGQVELRGLSFQYSKDDPLVLKDINLKIEPGQSVALVGRTGSGKTTIISLLQKLYNYETGQLLIDGMELNELAADAVRSRVGVVQQDNFIFKGTVASNIKLDNPAVSDDHVRRAAVQTGCLSLLEKRSDGLESKIEEGGSNLSVGERQLIAFARVLAFDPDIFILDEATANIDSESELKIQQATEVVTKGRTSIIIAHRLSTIRNCDKIVVLSDGKIIEAGSHDELLQHNGKYNDLYHSQFEHL
ncbi:MAG: ABC transporter ATP-binding protein [Bdellovibrionales bacterium]|nr:ABC transporter ATP-binding protein [Bdellovibrionales bacterium]